MRRLILWNICQLFRKRYVVTKYQYRHSMLLYNLANQFQTAVNNKNYYLCNMYIYILRDKLKENYGDKIDCTLTTYTICLTRCVRLIFFGKSLKARFKCEQICIHKICIDNVCCRRWSQTYFTMSAACALRYETMFLYSHHKKPRQSQGTPANYMKVSQ